MGLSGREEEAAKVGALPKPNPNWEGGGPPFLLSFSPSFPLLLQLGKGESYSHRE